MSGHGKKVVGKSIEIWQIDRNISKSIEIVFCKSIEIYTTNQNVKNINTLKL